MEQKSRYTNDHFSGPGTGPLIIAVGGSREVSTAFPDRAPRCALYTRVSTRDKGQDTANQLDHLRQFASTQGWTVVKEYQDHESGGKSDRSGFQAMMDAATRREFDVLLFWALDRLTREGTLPTLQYLNTLTCYGIGYRSFTEPYLDSCGIFKDAVVSILATIAKQEKLRISERVRAGMERVRKTGSKTGKPIGRPQVILRRDEVATLRHHGLSWSQIAARTGASIGTVRRAFARFTSAPTPCQNPSAGGVQ